MPIKKTIRWVLLTVFFLLFAMFAYAYYWLLASRPILEGTLESNAISSRVMIERDTQGIPLLKSDNRIDIAYGLGFLHAQERFFQMDLLRRNSAGELSELFGEAALAHDKKVRVHRFRYRAKRNLSHLTEIQLTVLSAYTQGVNDGLAQLNKPPFEYGILNQAPAPWRPEDSYLTLYSMYLTLQGGIAKLERGKTLMQDVLPDDVYQFLNPQGGLWEAPLAGDTLKSPELPTTPLSALLADPEKLAYFPMVQSEDMMAGSNNWAIGGALTSTGAAIVADDMHLGINMPNIWYRASWTLPETEIQMIGVTLPGAPAMIAGSNGHIAWGFTNSAGDWGDLIPLTVNTEGDRYKTPEGMRPFTVINEKIRIKDKAPVNLAVKETLWGPVIASDYRDRPLAYRWVAHDVEGANFNMLNLEPVTTTADAVRLAPTFGIPAQNFVVGDSQGSIGWTIAGAIPHRTFDGSHAKDWSDGTNSWQGYLPIAQYPNIVNPPDHRLWTANSRTLYTDEYPVLGNGGYAIGARSQQIRDGLFAKNNFNEKDMLAIQLDDRALFLQRWQQHLVSLVQSLPPGDNRLPRSPDAVLEQLTSWQGKASVDSVGYRLVRNYRLAFIELAMSPFVSALKTHDEQFELNHMIRYIEYPAWELLEKKPAHLLNPDFKSWEELSLTALTTTLDNMLKENSDLAKNTWGEQNKAAINHPFGRAVPFFNQLLSMPNDPLAGDTHMPRVQGTNFGASERLVVSPGNEQQAIFHMATGQSAHPLSPFFANGHYDWVLGNPSPLLPQNMQYTLTLEPAATP